MVKTIIFLTAILLTYNANAIKIEAVVNKEIITTLDLNKYQKMLGYTNAEAKEKSDSQLRKLALKEMIENSIKIQTAQKNGVTVGADEINEAKKRMFGDKKVDFPFDEKTYDNNIKTQMLWGRYINGRFASKANVTDSDVNQYFNTLKKEGKIGGEKINLAQITIADETKTNKVFDIIKDVKSCDKFVKEAELMGEIGSGKMGDILLSQMDKNVAFFLSTAPIKKVLSPFKNAAGYSIFFICSKESVSKNQEKELKEQIRQNLVQQKADVMGQKLLKDTISEFHININNEKYKDIINELN